MTRKIPSPKFLKLKRFGEEGGSFRSRQHYGIMIRGGGRKMRNLGIGEKKDPILIREPTIKPLLDIFSSLSIIVPSMRIARKSKIYKTNRMNKIQEIGSKMYIYKKRK
jgi:hypothetical protein